MKLNRILNKWTVGGALLLAIGLAAWSLLHPAPSPYETYTIQRGSIRSEVLATGVVQPENKLDIKPPINGRADDVLVAIGDKVKKGQVLAWMSSTDRAALLDAARTKGPEEVAHWEDFYKPAALIAPLDGTIINKNLIPGQVMTSNDVVFSMSDHLIVAANMDETDLAKIRLGEPVDLAVDAYPNAKFTGKVERIAYNSTTTNSVTTYEVDILPDLVPDFLRSGMTANANFIVAKKDDVLIAPAFAIRQTKRKSFVLAPKSPGSSTAVQREVTTGISDGKRTEIVSGLKEGDTIFVPKFLMGSAPANNGSPLIPSFKRPNSNSSVPSHP